MRDGTRSPRKSARHLAHHRKAAIEFGRTVLRICDDTRRQAPLLASVVANAFTIDGLSNDQNLCLELAEQIKATVASVRLSAVEQDRRRVVGLFQGRDRTSEVTRQLLDALGKQSATNEKMSAVWGRILHRLEELKARALDFETIAAVTHADCGGWSARLGQAVARRKSRRRMTRCCRPRGATLGITPQRRCC